MLPRTAIAMNLEVHEPEDCIMDTSVTLRRTTLGGHGYVQSEAAKFLVRGDMVEVDLDEGSSHVKALILDTAEYPNSKLKLLKVLIISGGISEEPFPPYIATVGFNFVRKVAGVRIMLVDHLDKSDPDFARLTNESSLIARIMDTSSAQYIYFADASTGLEPLTMSQQLNS